MSDAVVKIDSKLLKEVEKFVQENKFVFSSKKQVVNLAILEFLKLQKFKISDSSQKQIFLKSKSFIKYNERGGK